MISNVRLRFQTEGKAEEWNKMAGDLLASNFKESLILKIVLDWFVELWSSFDANQTIQ